MSHTDRVRSWRRCFSRNGRLARSPPPWNGRLRLRSASWEVSTSATPSDTTPESEVRNDRGKVINRPSRAREAFYDPAIEDDADAATDHALAETGGSAKYRRVVLPRQDALRDEVRRGLRQGRQGASLGLGPRRGRGNCRRTRLVRASRRQGLRGRRLKTERPDQRLEPPTQIGA